MNMKGAVLLNQPSTRKATEMAKKHNIERKQTTRSALVPAPMQNGGPLSPQTRNDRVMDMLIRDLDAAQARVAQLEQLANNFSVVARALYAQLAAREGSSVLRITAEELEGVQALDVDMTDEDGTLVLSTQEATHDAE